MKTVPRLAITERAFQDQVIELARVLHYRVYHTWSSQHSAAGFPDLVMTRRGRLIFAELKSETGRMRPEQCEWLEELEACGGPVEAYLWRPSQLQEIVAILRRDEEQGKGKGKGKKGRGQDERGVRRAADAAARATGGTGDGGAGGDQLVAAVRDVHRRVPGDVRRARAGADAGMVALPAAGPAAGAGASGQRRATRARGARPR